MTAPRAFAIYAGLTLAMFWNLLPDVATHLYSDLGDPLLVAAILAWNARHLPLSAEWWNFPAFAPLQGVTAFTEHLLAAYPIASPLIWLTGNPLLAYNAVFLLAIPANGVAMFLLARALTGSAIAALIAGLAFAFAPYQAGRLSHLQSMLQFGMPLALFGLHRYVESGRRSMLAVFGLGSLFALFANAYTMAFFPLLVGLWCVWFIRPAEWRTRLLPIAGVGLVTVLPLIPLLLGYSERQSAYGLARFYGETRSFSADVTALSGVVQRLVLWGRWLPTRYLEASIFPGVAILVLAVIGVAATAGTWTVARSAWPRRLGILAALLVLAAAVRAFAPAAWDALLPYRAFRVFTFGVICGVAALFAAPRFRHGWQTRSVVLFYAVACVTMWLLALGPEPAWNGQRILTYGPYRLLLELPGFTAIRVPARIWSLAVLCLAVLVGFGTNAVARRYAGGRLRIALLIAALIVAEGWLFDGTRVVAARVPEGIIPPGALVLDLPADWIDGNTEAQYRAVLGGYRSVNGHSGYYPPHFVPLTKDILARDDEALRRYRRDADFYVIVPFVDDPMTDRWVAGQPGAVQMSEFGTERVYRLPRLAAS